VESLSHEHIFLAILTHISVPSPPMNGGCPTKNPRSK
jgi:hypothetical protein